MYWGKLVTFFLFLCTSAYAGPDFSLGGVLPKGIYHPFVKMGFISSFTEKYNDKETLQSIDRFDIHLNAQNIEKMSPSDFNLLKSVLNIQSFPNQKSVENLDTGILHFSDESVVSYLAPGLAYGMNPSWTLGMVLPVVNYSSRVKISSVGYNNTREVFSQISKQNTELNEDLARAQEKLEKGPAYLFSEQLKEYGYKNITFYDQQYLGDMKLVSRYKLLEATKFSLYLNHDLNLPTGPQYDPDDLTALPIFHRFYLETGLLGSYYVSSKLGVGLSIKYKFNFPDEINMRVPEYPNQQLIPAWRKELLNRATGNEVIGMLSGEYSISDVIIAGGAFEYSIKGSDKYTGSRGYDYSLLDSDSDGYSGTVKVKAIYSTVEDYKRGTANIPYEVGYGFSDIIIGRNIERQTTHELSAKMFF